MVRAQNGDDRAREALFSRCRPLLQRWAQGRLPHFARDLADTDDVVQVTLMRGWSSLSDFEDRGRGSFLAYLRVIMLNTVKEELRRSGQRPEETERLDHVADSESVLSNVINADTVERYERALSRLTGSQRDAVILRLEFGLSYPELAAELSSPSSDAARMLVSRGLVRLAELMEA